MSESHPVPLTQLLSHSQTAQHWQEVNPAPAVENEQPTAPEPHPNPTTNAELSIHSTNLVPSLPTTSPLYRLTASGIYPQPSHTTANTSSTLPQPYMRPAPAVAGLLSHGFNPNAFLGELPQSSMTAFVGSNTMGHKKASILCMALGDREAPVCHILIYPFVSPHHHVQAKKHNYPHVQRGYMLPQSDTYNLELTDIEPFRGHMQKLGLCITYRPTSNDTYKDIHSQLLAHNADPLNPQIPGLKTDNLHYLTFDNMGWCFLQLMTRKPDNTLLSFNRTIKETQFNLLYMIQYASLESKFDGHRRRKYLATPGQFTLVIVPKEQANAYTLSSTNHCTYLSQSLEPEFSPGARQAELQPFPLPPPYYMGWVWPVPDRAELACNKHFPSFYMQMVDHMDTMGDNTMILKGPDIGALVDAVMTLCLFYAKTGWDEEKQVFKRHIDHWPGPQFKSADITCDNWSEPARFGQMRIVVDPSRSYGGGINKIVFREALIRALRDTDLYVTLPNSSAYFTAKLPMTGCMTRQTIQWRAQGLLLAVCTVTFCMLPLPISPFLFLVLIIEKRSLPSVLDALTGPVIKALDPTCEALEVGFQTTDSKKAIFQNRLVLRLILLSHPLAEQSDSFNALRQGFAFHFGHTSYTGGLPSLIQSGYPTIEDNPESLLEYLESSYDRKIHSVEALMEVIQVDMGLVATDTFCSRRCDWGFGKDPNGHDLPMYISMKKALEDALRTYFKHDLKERGTHFLEITTSLPYMPCGGSQIKTFHTSTCFRLVKIKLDVALCGLLAGGATDVFPNWTECLNFWLSDTTRTVTIL
ncbi:hypothetical protein IW261DRAFT_1591927 [Armillaria novae-zelandiae]|uniref:Uncharacterized protein n=1 Tax=Armillaria novae-zelandiae TaxID=153914 RepID=A0AA39PGL1_9AGAR|nr:hypothetical protein IW261DRAFT_1591927 [Armillaria novae-zelandiae]